MRRHIMHSNYDSIKNILAYEGIKNLRTSTPYPLTRKDTLPPVPTRG